MTAVAPPPLVDIVGDIAAALGPGWGVTAVYHAEVHVAGPDGESLRIARDHWSSGGNRLTINGVPPADLTGHTHRTEGGGGIGVNGGRPAAAVAADIRRRLLPGYRSMVSAGRCRQVAEWAEQQVRDDLIARVTAALGPRAVAAGVGPDGRAHARVGAYGGPAHVRMSVPAGDGTVELSVSVGQDHALILARALGAVVAEVHGGARG